MNVLDAILFLEEQKLATKIDGHTIQIQNKDVIQVLSLLKEAPYNFEVLMDLTGVDYLAPAEGTAVHYFLHNPTTYQRILVIAFVTRTETLTSVCSLWEGADWYERELYDLFGVSISGHPDLKRILLPDDWKGHPLRRDYPLTEEPVQFKHGVTPKVPSQIIPNVR